MDAFLSKKGQYAEKINPVYPTFVQKGLIFLICYKNHGKEGGYGAISEGGGGFRGLRRAAGVAGQFQRAAGAVICICRI